MTYGLVVVMAACGPGQADAMHGMTNETDDPAVVRIVTTAETYQFRVPPRSSVVFPQVESDSEQVRVFAILMTPTCRPALVTFYAQTGGQIENSWAVPTTWLLDERGADANSFERPNAHAVAERDEACSDVPLPPDPLDPVDTD